MTTPVFSIVQYLSPWAPLPPGFSRTGVQLNVTGTAPNNNVLAGRLRVGQQVYNTVVGTSAHQVIISPDEPLSAVLVYAVDVLWVAIGTSPDSIQWGNAITAPLLTAVANLVDAQVADGKIVLSWQYEAAAISPAGANVMVFDQNGKNVVWGTPEGNRANINFSPTPGNSYTLYIQPVLPINKSAAGTFAGPYSSGPVQSAIAIPGVDIAISAVNAKEDGIAASWPAPALPTNAGAAGYQLMVVEGDTTHIADAGATGGFVALSNVIDQANLQVAARFQMNHVEGLVSTPITVLTSPPVLQAVQAGVLSASTSKGVNATVTFIDSLPAGTTANVYLLRDGVVQGTAQSATAATSRVFLAMEWEGVTGLEVVAQYTGTDNSVVFTTPRSAPVPAVITAPAIVSTTIATSGNNYVFTLQLDSRSVYGLNVTNYSVKLVQGATNITIADLAIVGDMASFTVATSAITVINPYHVEVTALMGNAAYSQTTSMYVLFSAPAISNVSLSDSELLVNWARPANLGSVPDDSLTYRLGVTDTSGTVAFSDIVSGTSATIPCAHLPLASLASYNVVVDVLANGLLYQSPTTAAVALLTTPATNIGYQTAISGVMTLSWDDVTNATFLVSVNGAAAVATSTNSYPLPANPVFGQAMSFTVSVVKTDNNATQTSPPSAPLTIVTSALKLLDVVYNGTDATVSWTADTGYSGYSGFVISIYEQGQSTVLTTALVDAEVRSKTFASGITDLSKVYDVTVQGMSKSTTHSTTCTSIPSAIAPLYTPGWQLSPSSLINTVPFMYPSATLALTGAATLGTSGEAITLYLPQIADTAGLSGLPIDSGGDSGGNLPAITVQASATNPAYPYSLTIAAASAVWTFGATPLRADIYTAYQTLLTNLEAAGAKPWGIFTVRQALARMMPQSFAESALYHYGLRYPNAPAGVTMGSFDLMPGMVLRVVTNDYLTANDNMEYLNGYLNSSYADYEMGSYYQNQTWLQGFDSFIGNLVANGAITVGAPQSDTGAGRESGGADAADLYFTGFTEPFYRVFIPSALYPPNLSGSTLTTSNFMIAAANSYTNLNTMTNVISAGNASLAYFRGRAIIKAMIRISVNGNERLVPLGSSLQNVLESLGTDIPLTTTAITGVTLTRSLGNVVLDPNAPFDTQASYDVRVDWQQLTEYANGYTPLAVGLVHGDSITIGGNGGR